jgi:NTE family protein
MPKMGLVLQGGGALGAYEYGAVTRLVAITLDPVPFWPPERQTTFSIFGNPRFWRVPHDVFSYLDWTS